jgi:hypothetical protein
VEGLFQVAADGLGVVHRHGVLGDGLDDGDDVHLLYATLAQGAAVEAVWPFGLTGNHQHGHRVDPGAGHRGDGIGGAGAGGDQGHAETRVAGSAGATARFRCDGAALLVVARHWDEALFAGEGIVEVHRSTAGQQEYVTQTFIGKVLHDPVGYADRHGLTSSR